MQPKGFVKLVFFFLIVERLISLIIKIPLLEQIYRTIQYSYPMHSGHVLPSALLGPVLDIVVIIALIVVARNERILDKISGWLTK